MGLVVVGGVAVVLLLAVTVAALVFDAPVARPTAPAPEWILPQPQTLRAQRFRLAWRGYDPDEVDGVLAAVAEAYEELYVAIGPSGLARIRQRLAERRGEDVDGEGLGVT